MKNNSTLKSLAFTIVALLSVTACSKDNNEPNQSGPSGSDRWERKYLTLSAAIPDAEGTAGNGGTVAYSITPEQAGDPNFEVNVFAEGYGLRSQRTARVQASKNGNFLYNIQYTGNDGGIFNKYKVEGGKNFVDTREEVNTEPILGTSPRWVVAAEGIGVGVYASANVQGSATGAGADFVDVVSTAKIAVLDLDDPEIKRQTEFVIPFTAEQTKAGYQIGRIDVPVLNAQKNKLYIGCNLSRIDVTKQSGVNNSGNQTWTSTSNDIGTATLVVDYPSLSNPKLIFSNLSKTNNHSYRTMTQYVGTDGHVYQATATSGSQILRISKNTNDYDPSFNFDLKSALGTSNNISIRAWRYVKDGLGVVLYTESGVSGGYIALINLNNGSATKLNTEQQNDSGFSGLSASQNNGVALTGTFGQFQHIGVIGDKVYVPMTPNGIDGHIYIIDVNSGSITKGAKLKNQSGSFYIGAY